MLKKVNLHGVITQPQDVQVLKQQYVNIETALNWANENQQPQQALEICRGLYFFWEALGLFKDAQHWFKKLLDKAQAIKNNPLYTASLGLLGLSYLSSAQTEIAYDCLIKALAIALENHQLENQFKIYSYLGMMAAYQQDFVKVEENYGKSFAVCEELGQKNFQLHNTYARILLGQDKLEVAEYHAATGLAYAKSLKDQMGICAGLATLGSVQMQKNHLKTAKKGFLIAWEMAKSLEDLGEEAGILYCLGIIEYKSGQFVAAQTLLAQSFKPLLAFAEYAYLVSVLEFLASIQLLLTQPKQALMLWIAAKQLQKRQVVLFDPTVYRNTVSVQEIHKKLDAVEYCAVCQSLRGISLEKLNEKIMQFTQDLAILKP
jgi:tetratricopeptide (TPR) repeat protein